MARKKISISFSAPITLGFVLVCIGLFIIAHISDTTINNGYFAVGGNALSKTAFDRSSFSSYIAILIHIFAHSSWNILALNIVILLLLGPQIELAYGKALYSLMIIICAFVEGVLCTLFVSTHLLGAEGVALLFIILSILAYAKSKSIPFTSILLIFVYIMALFSDTSTSVSEKVVTCIGAFCASIFGFIDFIEQTKPAPRKKKVSKPQAQI